MVLPYAASRRRSGPLPTTVRWRIPAAGRRVAAGGGGQPGFFRQRDEIVGCGRHDAGRGRVPGFLAAYIAQSAGLVRRAMILRAMTAAPLGVPRSPTAWPSESLLFLTVLQLPWCPLRLASGFATDRA